MAYTFTPATFHCRFQGPRMTDAAKMFWSHYAGVDTPYVVIITDGVACSSPGYDAPSLTLLAAADDGSGRNGKAIFVGGYTYTITAGERTILLAAGYTVEGS